jgi:hypothetical protein
VSVGRLRCQASNKRATVVQVRPRCVVLCRQPASSYVLCRAQVPSHGLVIVTYPGAKKEQKQETDITAAGYTRNKLGGFYTS